MSFADFNAAARRLAILRAVVDLNGEANEAVIASIMRQSGFGHASRDDIRADLDHLERHGATRDEWLDTLRVVRLTERGEDCAYGRVEIDGVEHSIWRRAK